MRENKHVSVVIPNYNGIQYMEVCLEALAQQLPPEQIIVVDNGSTDGSREWVASLSVWIKTTAFAAGSMRESGLRIRPT